MTKFPWIAAIVFAAPLFSADVDGIAIHSSVAGKGRKAVMFVHGWTCSEDTWTEQIPALRKKYRVVTIDLPGHGSSGSPAGGKFSMDLFARAIEAVRVERKLDKLVLVGHSMGTSVIVQYARLYPQHVAAMVFVDGPVSMTQHGPANPKMWIGEEGRKTREKMVKSMFNPSTPAATQSKISDMMLRTPEATAAGAMTAMFDPSIWKGDTFTIPVLGLYADKSPVGNRSYMKEHYPKMEYHEIPGTGHFLMLEKPAEFNRLLLEFLDKQSF